MAKDEITSALDKRIALALEASPRFEISAGFAAKVAQQLPPRPAAVLTPTHYGYWAAVGCVLALLALMLVFAHRATGTSVLWISIEWTLCVQFVLLAIWLVARRAGYTLTSTF
jgi:hypothetical protein